MNGPPPGWPLVRTVKGAELVFVASSPLSRHLSSLIFPSPPSTAILTWIFLVWKTHPPPLRALSPPSPLKHLCYKEGITSGSISGTRWRWKCGWCSPCFPINQGVLSCIWQGPHCCVLRVPLWTMPGPGLLTAVGNASDNPTCTSWVGLNEQPFHRMLVRTERRN